MSKEREKNKIAPQPEVFVISKKNEELLEIYSNRCQSLFGSDVKYDVEGNIFYPVWHEVKTEKVGPGNYSLLSKKPFDESWYLSLGLKTKRTIGLKIHKITKDGGSVEAAIRSVDHILKSKLEKEKPQVNGVKRRVDELLDLFSDFSNISNEELQNSQEKTCQLLENLGFDPDKIILEERKRMINWLVKASGGKDILGRRNLLITTMALEASYRRAIEFGLGIGEAVSKFTRMREALIFERNFSRESFKYAEEWLKHQRLPSHYLFKYPEKSRQNIGVVKGILRKISQEVGLPHVKPYKPAGMEVKQILDEITKLLIEDRRKEIVERDLFKKTYDLIETTLKEHEDIYPNQISFIS